MSAVAVLQKHTKRRCLTPNPEGLYGKQFQVTQGANMFKVLRRILVLVMVLDNAVMAKGGC